MQNFINWLLKFSEDFQLTLYFACLLVLIVAEQFFHYRKIIRKKRWFANFVITLIAILTMMVIPFTFISSAKYAGQHQWGLFNLVEVNWIIVGILTLLLRGFISFFTHYLMHKVPILWRIHRVHHLDTELDVSTTIRFHPFEFLINALIGIPIILLFGFPVWVLMLYELFDVVITLVSHSNINFSRKLNSILQYVVVTPELHRVHHSSHQPETDSNYGAVFPVWDLVFGTFKTITRDATRTMQLGLEEIRDERTNNISWLLLSPFKSFKNRSDKEKKVRFSPPGLYKLFIAIMLLTFFLPVKTQIKFPYNLTGIILFAAGAFVAVQTKKMFKKTGTPIAPDANPQKLHTHGYFRFTRNPMYLGITTGLAGVALLTGTISNFLFPVIYIIMMEIFFVRPEEKLLEEKFGKTFVQYKQKTRRWI